MHQIRVEGLALERFICLESNLSAHKTVHESQVKELNGNALFWFLRAGEIQERYNETNRALE